MTTDRTYTPGGKAAEDRLQALLDGRYRDPDTGKPIALATKSLIIADSLVGMEAELVEALDMGRRLAVVSDVATHDVLGAQVERALAGHFDIQSLILPADPLPDDATAERLRAATRDVDGYLAVGSGTINDLTKFVSAQAGKPYAVFGTAPSMNGYVSLTASITMHGHKMTVPAQAPKGAFFDLGVLAAAPVRMIRAGLGDSICRTTAQVDWLLSHLLLGTDYRSLPFDLLARDEPELLDRAAALTRGDADAVRTLIRTLVLSGFGTAIVGSSAPASQGEHLVSHYIDMLANPSRAPIFHGEQVGVTTLSLARLQHQMLRSPPVVQPDTLTEADIRTHFGSELSDSVMEEFAAKRIDNAKAERLNAVIAEKWEQIVDALSAVLLPIARLESVLTAAGAPTTPADIGLDRAFYETALYRAREIRNRFTMLDLAAAGGRLGALRQTI